MLERIRVAFAFQPALRNRFVGIFASRAAYKTIFSFLILLIISETIRNARENFSSINARARWRTGRNIGGINVLSARKETGFQAPVHQKTTQTCGF